MQLCLLFKHQPEKQRKKTHYVNVNFVDAKETMIIVSKMPKPIRKEKEKIGNYVKELIADVKLNKDQQAVTAPEARWDIFIV
jgi:hypothetical protein